MKMDFGHIIILKELHQETKYQFYMNIINLLEVMAMNNKKIIYMTNQDIL